MPIKRFAHDLDRDGKRSEYMSLLVNHFNPDTLPGLMCHNLLSIGYDGRLYDCDFNQMLEIDLPGDATTIWQIDDLSLLEGAPIATASHCFACTAGAGSGCSAQACGSDGARDDRVTEGAGKVSIGDCFLRGRFG